MTIGVRYAIGFRRDKSEVADCGEWAVQRWNAGSVVDVLIVAHVALERLSVPDLTGQLLP